VQQVIVVSPDDTGISSARAKTDKLDSRTLAGLLCKGELDAVWMPDERCRTLRRRLARREQLVRGRTRAKNEIQAVLQRRLQAKGSLTCSASRAAGGWLISSCRSRSANRSTRGCGRSRSWTQRSPRSTG
jgi:transposase